MTRRWWVILLVSLVCASAPGEAAWVWSPQTGWIGPSGVVKDTPQEQLSHALGFFQEEDYHRARVEFQKLAKQYPDSPEAAEGQYYVGRCQEEQGSYYAAFVAYRQTIEVYPATERFEEILERMSRLGNYFLSGKKRRIFGGPALLPAKDKAVEIFKAMVEEGPFSQHGELAQYKLGQAYLSLGEYEQAVGAFEQLIDRYPNSPLVDDARFQITQASLKGSFRPGYDQVPTEQALEELEEFIDGYKASDLLPDAIEQIQVLRERRAEHEFQIAQFYEEQQRLDSARIYYRGLLADYPDTSWAEKAKEQLTALESQAP